MNSLFLFVLREVLSAFCESYYGRYAIMLAFTFLRFSGKTSTVAELKNQEAVANGVASTKAVRRVPIVFQ